jgi:hypothetical protein
MAAAQQRHAADALHSGSLIINGLLRAADWRRYALPLECRRGFNMERGFWFRVVGFLRLSALLLLSLWFQKFGK